MKSRVKTRNPRERFKVSKLSFTRMNMHIETNFAFPPFIKDLCCYIMKYQNATAYGNII